MDDGLFGPESVTWRVHLEPVLWVGGFRALLLQSLHPRVMRGTYQNSALFDPAKAWARFQRTVEFVGVRTFAPTAEVEAAAARVRRLHAGLRGHDPDTGETFALDDPELLLWVHCHGDRLLRRGGPPRRRPRRRRGGGVPGRERARGPGGRAAGRARHPRGHAELPGSGTARAAAHRRGPGGVWATCSRRRARRPRPEAGASPPWPRCRWRTLPRWARRMYGLPGLPTTDLGATAALRALRGLTDRLPDAAGARRRSCGRAGWSAGPRRGPAGSSARLTGAVRSSHRQRGSQQQRRRAAHRGDLAERPRRVDRRRWPARRPARPPTSRWPGTGPAIRSCSRASATTSTAR